MNILFLVPYPLKQAPSQRFRFEQYFKALEQRGYTYHVQSFLTDHNWRRFAERSPLLPKLVILFKGFFRRLTVLPTIPGYDLIFIHREITPLGPPVFEWLIAKTFKKRIIYDFDDAIWLTDRQDESYLFARMKWRSKVKNICKWSYKISCGNQFLCAYASLYCKNVIYNPTTIDTEALAHQSRGEAQNGNTITLGWTGSNSTLKYLSEIQAELQDIEKTFPCVQFLVIADKKPELDLSRMVYKPWRIETEIADLLEIDIGIMPLPDDEWTKGKCGFKALQYMALGIPTIASCIGTNPTIIDHALNGFLVSSSGDWKKYCTLLISEKGLRATIGAMGRQKVIKNYSVRSNEERFLSLFA